MSLDQLKAEFAAVGLGARPVAEEKPRTAVETLRAVKVTAQEVADELSAVDALDRFSSLLPERVELALRRIDALRDAIAQMDEELEDLGVDLRVLVDDLSMARQGQEFSSPMEEVEPSFHEPEEASLPHYGGEVEQMVEAEDVGNFDAEQDLDDEELEDDNEELEEEGSY